MDEHYYECCQKNVIFSKNLKKNKFKTIYVGFFQHKSTNEMLKS
jgi:hypothetical protein